MCFWVITSPSAFWLPLEFNVKEVPVREAATENPDVKYLKNHSVRVHSRGRWYTIKRPKDWGNIRILKQGSDGSYLAKYGHEDIYTYWIIYKGRHWPAPVPDAAIVSVDEYTDRNNYLVNVIEEVGARGMPESPAIVFEYKNGECSKIGEGTFEFRVRSGIAVTTETDSVGRPVSASQAYKQEKRLLRSPKVVIHFPGRDRFLRAGNDQFLMSAPGIVQFFSNGDSRFLTLMPNGMSASFPNSLADFLVTIDGDSQHHPADVEGIFYKGEFRKVEMPGVPLEDVSSVSWKSRTSMVLTTKVGGKTRNYLASIKA